MCGFFLGEEVGDELVRWISGDRTTIGEGEEEGLFVRLGYYLIPWWGKMGYFPPPPHALGLYSTASLWSDLVNLARSYRRAACSFIHADVDEKPDCSSNFTAGSRSTVSIAMHPLTPNTGVPSLPLRLLPLHKLPQHPDPLLQRAQPPLHLLPHLRLILRPRHLGVEIPLVRRRRHGGAEDGLDEEGMVRLQGRRVRGAERVGQLRGRVRERVPQGRGGEVEPPRQP